MFTLSTVVTSYGWQSIKSVHLHFAAAGRLCILQLHYSITPLLHYLDHALAFQLVNFLWGKSDFRENFPRVFT